MSGPSVYHWGWFKRPGAYIENGLIIKGKEAEPYQPGDNMIGLLNSVQGIISEQTALEFTKQWGLLGLIDTPAASNDKWSRISGATAFTYITRKREGLAPDIHEVQREVIRYFNPNDESDLTPKGEPVSVVLEFAHRMRGLSEVSRLLELYKYDQYAAEFEAEGWINSLTSEQADRIYNVPLDIVKEQYRDNEAEYSLCHYILDVFIIAARHRLSDRSQRGIWIELYQSPIAGRPQGYPIIQFDSLFRFIEYILLAEGSTAPKRCEDPKCGQLFFPSKADQRYCPAPPGVSRSRCENRHTQELRRQRAKS